jgi:hypothetical protein
LKPCGGAACPFDNQAQTCNDFPCPCFVEVSSFSPWSECTKSCSMTHPGTQSRTRSVTNPECSSEYGTPYLEETRDCNVYCCPEDCTIPTTWGDWSACSRTCGGGTRTRSRTFTQPSCGGLACPHDHEMQTCNDFYCPWHCEVSSFSAWSICTKSCVECDANDADASGVCPKKVGETSSQQSRSRSIIRHATSSHNNQAGYVCPYLAETRDCDVDCCATFCEVSSFSPWTQCPACSKCTPSGTDECTMETERQSRTRSIVSDNWNKCTNTVGNYECPYLEETRDCQHYLPTDCCPEPCVVVIDDQWETEWTACSKSCTEGCPEVRDDARYTVTDFNPGTQVRISKLVTHPCYPNQTEPYT